MIEIRYNGITTDQETEETNMLYNDFNKELVNLQDLNIINFDNSGEMNIITCEMSRKKHHCICCGTQTDTVHDYRWQNIKDLSAFGKPTVIRLHKRRYRCPNCDKRFFEDNSFLPRYYRTTTRLSAYIIDKLRDVRSYTSIARETGLSVSTVIRRFDLVSYPTPKLPACLAIDEFKGNTGNEKYNCIITDPESKRVLDILPKRYDYYLSSYFNQWNSETRDKVKFFISDMWRPYTTTASAWLKNAVQIVDKYHWIRQIIWSFENVRKQEQKRFSKEYRRYFKHSKTLLTKKFDYLTDEQKQQVNVMLYTSPNLSRAHYFKESFLKILDCKDTNSSKEAMKNWILGASDCGIPQIEKCAATMRNWLTGILNSFSSSLTNGFTEGCNNKIKVLKRNAYGFRNFSRFRNRILHIFSHQACLHKSI